ncbi:hypothetical protein [Echinimonas agarilytica]|uniref:Uncharacterized protein n=1 Tax=Echinimonas agarilytica TaxID=1215918 RepID=A0AA41W7Z3_9GAMM|nr:hypothetical protein [Echinimonas agarilytica]MCM2680103.1 hypothetical protein [Echinimonas agarilytica]
MNHAEPTSEVTSHQHHHAEHSDHQSQAQSDDATKQHACCGPNDSGHDMSKILSSQFQLASLFAALAFSAIMMVLPVIKRLFCAMWFYCDTEPPKSGYPPLFMTTQRLLH